MLYKTPKADSVVLRKTLKKQLNTVLFQLYSDNSVTGRLLIK